MLNSNSKGLACLFVNGLVEFDLLLARILFGVRILSIGMTFSSAMLYYHVLV